jgi:hypothetical protein
LTEEPDEWLRVVLVLTAGQLPHRGERLIDRHRKVRAGRRTMAKPDCTNRPFQEGSVMCQKDRSRVSAFAFSLALLLYLTPVAEAVDGVVLIDQNRALAGNITPGDLPGFPVTISRAGSYRLSGNLDIADPDTTAIEVTADHVTLDLNGFRIQGPLDQCSFFIQPVWCQNGVLFGIGVLARRAGTNDVFQKHISVLNGSVRAMGSTGVAMGDSARVEKLAVVDNRGYGITVGESSIILGNTVSQNRQAGITAREATVVLGNTVARNGGPGLSGNSGVGYSNNGFAYNNSEGVQVVGGPIPIGGNMCGNAICL